MAQGKEKEEDSSKEWTGRSCGSDRQVLVVRDCLKGHLLCPEELASL